MNKYHIITLILCLFCLGGAATASPDRTAAAPDTQARSSQLKVSGIIKDDAGSPLIGVTIVVKGTSSGSVSNSDGSYTITVPYAEATLMVSYIGYAPQEIGVNNRTRIDITMVEDSKALEEVVVVGYNVQKKETITGSISTITTKDLKQSPTANINNALAGRMPGLLVNQFNGGEPGNDAAQLNIRGKSTYGKSDVIMIVDGIERDMSYLSPDEIETFTILKDASATAPYGIRGANGVIIVTTKRGRKGEKPTVDFKASVGVSEPIRYPDYLGSADYATLYNEAMLNDNPSLDPGSASLFSQETISNFRRAKGDNSDGLGYNWDYFDYAFKPSILQDYSLSVRGGTDRARYFILGSYYNQGGNYKHSNSDNVNKFLRYNFRANVDVDATKRLKISVDLGARVTEYNYPGATAANIISLANTQPPLPADHPAQQPQRRQPGRFRGERRLPALCRQRLPLQHARAAQPHRLQQTYAPLPAGIRAGLCYGLPLPRHGHRLFDGLQERLRGSRGYRNPARELPERGIVLRAQSAFEPRPPAYHLGARRRP